MIIKEYVLSIDELKKKFPIGSIQIIDGKKCSVKEYGLPQSATNLATYPQVIFEEIEMEEEDLESATITIKYLDPDMEELKYIEGKSDWIDLRSYEDVDLKAGEFKLINLGVCMVIPKGYEAHVAPRSSTFKKWGILQVNSVGIIDNSYCGDGDIWFMPVYATRDTHISKGDRICQFRIFKNQPEIVFIKTDRLGTKDRGGIGSTGTK